MQSRFKWEHIKEQTMLPFKRLQASTSSSSLLQGGEEKRWDEEEQFQEVFGGGKRLIEINEFLFNSIFEQKEGRKRRVWRMKEGFSWISTECLSFTFHLLSRSSVRLYPSSIALLSLLPSVLSFHPPSSVLVIWFNRLDTQTQTHTRPARHRLLSFASPQSGVFQFQPCPSLTAKFMMTQEG